MTKAELVQRVAKKNKQTKALTNRVIDTSIEELHKLLEKGGSISFTGFGSLGIAKRAKRKGRNPRTGAELNIPATKVVRFKAGKGLSEAISGKKK